MPSFGTRGFSIYYETYGDDGRAPLVLVMGMGGTCQGWTVTTVPELSKQRRVIIFDNRGAGRSEDPGTPFTTADMAEDTLALLDELEIERAHVLGGFLGGMVAQELAIAHPERVGCLILHGTWAKADAKRRAIVELWKEMIENGVPAETRIKNRLAWTLSDATFETDVIERMWRFYLQDDAPMEEKVFTRQAEASIAHDASDRLNRIHAPTLVVCGEEDILTPSKLHRSLAGGIANSRFVEMAGGGHLVAAEFASRFNSLVLRFLEEHDPAVPPGA
jgi:pimeloyl-ACP methyl ester carboxylesterase